MLSCIGFIRFEIYIDVLSDILSYVMTKDFQQHVKVDMPVMQIPQQGKQISQQVMTREVLRNCFVFLRALAYNNELVSAQLAMHFKVHT